MKEDDHLVVIMLCLTALAIVVAIEAVVVMAISRRRQEANRYDD